MDDFSKALATTKPPTAPATPNRKYRTQKREKQKMLLEAAAIAYVQMENGEWRPSGDSRRCFDEDGNPTPNTRELMRIAGYAKGSWDMFHKYLEPQEEFWKLVELYRMRRNDPMFSANREKDIWSEIGNRSLEYIYETVTYAPHSISLDQHLKVVNTVVSAIGTLGKADSSSTTKTASLLRNLPEEKRAKVLKDYKSNLSKELEELENLELVYEAESEDL